MTTQPIEIDVPFKVDKISCDGCAQKYVLLAIFERENEYLETEYNYMHQAKVYYCPYCGHNNKLKSRKRKNK